MSCSIHSISTSKGSLAVGRVVDYRRVWHNLNIGHVDQTFHRNTLSFSDFLSLLGCKLLLKGTEQSLNDGMIGNPC